MPYTRNVVFDPAIPAPANGYRLRYRIQGSNAAWITLTSATSPIVVTGLVDGATYEAFLDADCGGGTFSYPPVPLTFLPPGDTTTTSSTSTTTTQYTNVSVQSTLAGTTVTNVTGISGFTWSGGPMGPGSERTGLHNAFTGTVSVVITGPPILAGNIVLKKNGVVLQCINLGTGLTYPYTATFVSHSFTATDLLEIDLNTGVCSTSNTQIYFGAKATSGLPTIGQLDAGPPPTLQDPNQDVAVDWTPFNASPLYCYVLIPDTAPAKNFWYVSPINNGAIGSTTDLFPAPQVMMYNGVNYKAYVTNYPTQFTAVCYMQEILA